MIQQWRNHIWLWTKTLLKNHIHNLTLKFISDVWRLYIWWLWKTTSEDTLTEDHLSEDYSTNIYLKFIQQTTIWRPVKRISKDYRLLHEDSDSVHYDSCSTNHSDSRSTNHLTHQSETYSRSILSMVQISIRKLWIMLQDCYGKDKKVNVIKSHNWQEISINFPSNGTISKHYKKASSSSCW